MSSQDLGGDQGPHPQGMPMPFGLSPHDTGLASNAQAAAAEQAANAAGGMEFLNMMPFNLMRMPMMQGRPQQQMFSLQGLPMQIQQMQMLGSQANNAAASYLSAHGGSSGHSDLNQVQQALGQQQLPPQSSAQQQQQQSQQQQQQQQQQQPQQQLLQGSAQGQQLSAADLAQQLSLGSLGLAGLAGMGMTPQQILSLANLPIPAGQNTLLQSAVSPLMNPQLAQLRQQPITGRGRLLICCDSCSKRFLGNQRLVWHRLMRPEDLKSRRCDVCGGPFDAKEAEDLDKKRSGEGEGEGEGDDGNGQKPFHCKLCDASFYRGDRLLAHSRVHTGEKPFQCDLCPRAFSRKDRLKAHRRTHTGETPYKCPHCSKAFMQSSHLNKHIRSTHADDSADVPKQGKKSASDAGKVSAASQKHDPPPSASASGDTGDIVPPKVGGANDDPGLDPDTLMPFDTPLSFNPSEVTGAQTAASGEH